VLAQEDLPPGVHAPGAVALRTRVRHRLRLIARATISERSDSFTRYGRCMACATRPQPATPTRM